jgi:DNA-binding NtrC family response regulator
MRKRILIVDDGQVQLNLMQHYLRKFKNEYEVFATTNSNDALKLIEEFEVDLLITDILIPDKDGMELIGEVRQKYPRVKIIAMSGGGSIAGDQYLEIAEKLGSSWSLNKPFSKDELISGIKYVLGKSE